MLEKTWLDDIPDEAEVRVSALKLKALAQDAEGILAVLSIISLVDDFDHLRTYLPGATMRMSTDSFLLKESVLDILRDFKDKGL